MVITVMHMNNSRSYQMLADLHIDYADTSSTTGLVKGQEIKIRTFQSQIFNYLSRV